VYDKISGALLEMNIELTSPLLPSENYRMSFSVVDTNIFSSSTPTEPSIDPVYIIAAIVAVVLVMVVVFLVLKRKKKPPISTPPAQTPESKNLTLSE
jgi:heme/copper-type cytochrome/quinol oxidase subunit 2